MDELSGSIERTTVMESLGLAGLVSIAAIAPSRANQDVLLTAVSFASLVMTPLTWKSLTEPIAFLC